MKAKLLKKLRKKMYIEYIPSFGEYRAKYFHHITYFDDYYSAKNYIRINLLSYARQHYDKYLKKIKVY